MKTIKMLSLSLLAAAVATVGSRGEPFLLARISAGLKNWRVALPLAGATAAVVALSVSLLNFGERPDHKGSAHVEPPTQAVMVPNLKGDIDSTAANYQRVASRSLEKLDDLLASQANRQPVSAPIFTAAMVTGANLPD